MFKQFTPFTYTGTVRNDRERTAFVPCAPSQPLSLGYVDHSNGSAFIAGVELVTIERKTVPSDVVKREAAKRCDSIEKETGRRPKGKHLKEIKEEITRELLVKAFPKRKTVPVLWLDSYVLVGSTSSTEVDLLTTFLTEQGADLRLDNLNTGTEPCEAMTRWARHPDSEGTPFAVGQDMTVLTGEGKATFKTVNVQSPEALAALSVSNTVTALALTSQRDVSFTLTEMLQVKKLAVGGTVEGDHADAAAAECHLFRGELQALMTELVDALGGLVARDAA